MLKLCIVVVVVVVGVVMCQDCGYSRGNEACDSTISAVYDAIDNDDSDNTAICAAIDANAACFAQAYSHCSAEIQKDVADGLESQKAASGRC